MDQDGLFLMLKMCNGCSHNKGSWKKCMSRRHNPRMSTVRKEELTFGHRQCVKPDQAITIYKLRDHETNEEFLEFDEQIIFQTACPSCLNIKSCLKSGHKLVDWRPTFAGGRVAGTPISPPTSPQSVTPSSKGGGEGGGSGKKGKKGGKGTTAGGGKRKRRSSAGAGAAAADDDDEGGDGDSDGAAAGRKGSSLEGGRRAGSEGTPHAKAAPKSSHKRKSPGSSASDLAKNLKISAPRSVADPESSKPATPAAKPTARRSRGNSASGGATKRNRRNNGDAAGATPKMEIDTSVSTSEAAERPLKRRGKQQTPAAVTLSPNTEAQESFEACSAGEEEAAPNGDGVAATRNTVPKTVAEKLEMVKSEEAELLRQFEDTHRRCAQKEDDKREEMAEFQRAGEAALLAMQEEKEELLRRISDERKKKAAERGMLLQERLKEFEAEEAASRAEAKERDARLEAEKEMLSRECAADLVSSAAAAAAAAAASPFSAGNGGWKGPPGDGGGDSGNHRVDENGVFGSDDAGDSVSSKTAAAAKESAAAAAAMAEAKAAMSMSLSMSQTTANVATVEESADDRGMRADDDNASADPSASAATEATRNSKRAGFGKAVSGREVGKSCNVGGGLSSTRSSAAAAAAAAVLAKVGPDGAEEGKAEGGGGEGANGRELPGVELVSPDVSEPEMGAEYDGGVVPVEEDAPESATDSPDEVGNSKIGRGGKVNGVARSSGPQSVAVQ